MTATTPGANRLQFDVDGMTCEHCRTAITSEVSDVAGVSDIDVDLDAGIVTVSGAELAEQVLRDAIMLAGYDARLRTA